MWKFLLGVIVTLAILHPAVTKTVLNQTVDTIHQSASAVVQTQVNPAKQ